MALRAINLETARIAWEIPQTGNSNNYGGTLSTAGGLVFYGQASGEFAAVDAETGTHLWHFETHEIWKSSPMTYMVNGKQYIATASGPNILAFALDLASTLRRRGAEKPEKQKTNKTVRISRRLEGLISLLNS